MITIHAYCSYRLSPVGYQYGILRYPASGSGSAGNLSPPGQNFVTDFVTKAFDNGFITGVSGKVPVPDLSRYLLLVKKRHYSYPEGHQDIGKDVTINLAFEFDDFDEFCRFAISFEKANSENSSLLDKKMADLILPDYNAPTYGLKIDLGKLDVFFKEMNTEQPNARIEELRHNVTISVLSASKDYDSELQRLFGFQANHLSRNGKIYTYGKKKAFSAGNPNRFPLLPVLLLIIVLLALLFFLTTRSQAKAIPDGIKTVTQETESMTQKETANFSGRTTQYSPGTNNATSQDVRAQEESTKETNVPTSQTEIPTMMWESLNQTVAVPLKTSIFKRQEQKKIGNPQKQNAANVNGNFNLVK